MSTISFVGSDTDNSLNYPVSKSKRLDRPLYWLRLEVDYGLKRGEVENAAKVVGEVVKQNGKARVVLSS